MLTEVQQRCYNYAIENPSSVITVGDDQFCFFNPIFLFQDSSLCGTFNK